MIHTIRRARHIYVDRNTTKVATERLTQNNWKIFPLLYICCDVTLCALQQLKKLSNATYTLDRTKKTIKLLNHTPEFLHDILTVLLAAAAALS